jgi:hypothetical protein
LIGLTPFPGIEHVAGIERIEGRAPFDQLAAVVDHLLRVAVLLRP